METEEGPPWVAGLAQLLTALDPGRQESEKQPGFLVSPLPIPAPTWALQEIADTTSGDKSSLETRFMMILCTRSYPHLRRGETQLPPLPRQASAVGSGDLGSIPGSGRTPGGGNGTHSSILPWKIPWTEEPGG